MRTLTREIVVIGLLGVGGVLFAQGTRTPLEDSQNPLLSEVRALRAEVQQIASVGIRTQLLVARLQLQEQRVVMAGQQLREAQDTLAGIQQEIAAEQARVAELEKSPLGRTPQGQVQLQQAILEAKTQIERQRSQEAQWQARVAECLRAVNDSQAQWMNFSERLDALERSLPAYVSH